jgi:hypothetical protein
MSIDTNDMDDFLETHRVSHRMAEEGYRTYRQELRAIQEDPEHPLEHFGALVLIIRRLLEQVVRLEQHVEWLEQKED